MRVQATLRLLVSLLLLLSAGRVLADTAADIRKLEQERFAAYVQGDVAALDRIFANDLVYFHSNGLSDPKSGVLQSFASGDLNISRFEAEDLQVREIGNVMVATGLVHVGVGQQRHCSQVRHSLQCHLCQSRRSMAISPHPERSHAAGQDLTISVKTSHAL